MLVFNNYFCKSKLHFGDRVAVLNILLYQIGGSMHVRIVVAIDVSLYVGVKKEIKQEVS
jgi:hypothetical protein